jgi:hypothetical protein
MCDLLVIQHVRWCHVGLPVGILKNQTKPAWLFIDLVTAW